ncbi:uncharacterized protein PFLUO_LOCUS2003 [Penicillium psychrofluorescens]|uniref:uncharacterized protein n=1 Tax=Penicillium psychrofluorescens TaxID=3158075 RepID=UPI003CCD598E
MAEDIPVAVPTAEAGAQPERAPATEPAAPASEEKKDTETPAEKPAAVDGPSDTKGEGAAAADAQANGTPSAKKSSKDRRRSSGVAGGNSKLSRKKSQSKITNVNAKPGEYYLARLRSYAPWPAIVCDEVMLPQSLLQTRPVTAMQPDGTYKGDFVDGGKRTHDRTFPVMFFETNEFAWIPNTQLTPLDPAECKDVSEKGKAKPLIAAYKIAAEGHDLEYFKSLLADHQAALQQEIDEREAQEAAKAAAKAEKAKKSKRKSKGADTDVDMEDAEKKSSKKRKKDAETDGESKPSKTPKTSTKLKLTSPKAPGDEKKTPASKSKKAAAPKKGKAASDDEPAPEPEKPIDPEELKKKKEREVLLLRHKLQKGFISRDAPPKEEEMETMATFFDKLEKYTDLEVSIIRTTKINKVLKMIVRLNSIPRDEDFKFRRRAMDILSSWKNVLDSDIHPESASKDSLLTANGAPKDDESADTPKIESEEKEPETKPAKEDAVDIPMPDAGADKATAEEKAVPAEGETKPTDDKPAEEKTAETTA